MFLGVVGDVPQLELWRVRAFDAAAELAQVLVLADEGPLRLGAQVVQELLCARARMGHAIVDHQVGEIREPQELSLLPPQLEDSADDFAIVELARCRPHVVGVINLLPDSSVV